MSDSFHEGTGANGEEGTSGESGDSGIGALAAPSGVLDAMTNGGVLARVAIRSFAFAGEGVGADVANAAGAAGWAGTGAVAAVFETGADCGSGATVIALRFASVGLADATLVDATSAGPVHGDSFPARACTRAMRGATPERASRRT